MDKADIEKGKAIAKKNDTVRKLGLNVLVTQGIKALPDVDELMHEIRSYNYFPESVDPYYEHDFGKLIWHGKKVFWKIDYYNETLTAWEDPLSPKCKRILTVMLASEY